ncbi:MAG: family N-acetyltransferase, partial [Nocardioidaceae bacterium]|nr:family N-acetyltransferase [Nocardioidaceae bacterium]
DAGELVAFYARVSDESKYFRFFAPYPKLSDKDVRRFTTVDHDRRVAFVITIRERIIGVGRYDAIGDTDAEVAFLVEDAHQGRGLGQLLLEHLAQAGRERGMKRFYADILPDNSRMIQIFRELGYVIESALDGGVVRLALALDPTTMAIGVMQAREQRAEAASIERIFNASSVAVVGASRRQDSIGQALVRNLVLGDYSGSVYAVNPQAEAVSGLPAYRSVSDIPGDVDMAIIAVPGDAVSEVILDCANKGVHGVVVISSGFAEQGRDGRIRQQRLLGMTRRYGMRLIGPNCLGIISTHPSMQLNASLSGVMPPRGRVGFFCQSGALGTAILETVDRRGLGLSTFVSAGNRADVSGNDLLQYWQQDEATEVILLYLESIGNPRKFSRIARRVSQSKPIVAVKSGRSTQGVPVGHAVKRTSAPQAAVDAMFRQAGVIQVDTLDEMFDVAQLLAHQPLPRGPRVAIVGNSDAMGLLVADAATAAGLIVSEPISLGAGANADDFEQALDAALDNPAIDALVTVYIPPLNTTGEEVANVLAAVGEQSDKPIVSSFLGSEGVPQLLRVPDLGGAAGRGSVPSYSAPESAVRALARVVNYAAWAGRDHGKVSLGLDHATGDARALIRQVLAEAPRGALLSTEQTHYLLACYGIDLWMWVGVHSKEEAKAAGERLGWEVVLKAASERLRVRPDLAHVWRNIHDASDMDDAWDNLVSLVGDYRDTQYIVQKMSPPGVPLTFRATEDALFGPIVSFGLAGASSDLLNDRSYGIPPLTDVDAATMISDLKSAPLLFGYRGSTPADVGAIADFIQRIAALKDDLPEVAELDLEPVLSHEKGLTALSARAKIMPTAETRSEWYVRRLGQPSSMGDTLPG